MVVVWLSDRVNPIVWSLSGTTVLKCRVCQWRYSKKRLEYLYMSPRPRYICILCLVPCSAPPKSAVILRCFFLRYLLTPEVSLAVRRRAAATTGEMCLNALLSKCVQTGTIFVSRGGTDTDVVVAVNSDKSLATGRGAFSSVKPSRTAWEPLV